MKIFFNLIKYFRNKMKKKYIYIIITFFPNNSSNFVLITNMNYKIHKSISYILLDLTKCCCGLTIDTFISFHTNKFIRNIRKCGLVKIFYIQFYVGKIILRLIVGFWEWKGIKN